MCLIASHPAQLGSRAELRSLKGKGSKTTSQGWNIVPDLVFHVIPDLLQTRFLGMDQIPLLRPFRRDASAHAKEVNEIEHLAYQRFGERFYRLIDLLRGRHFYLRARRQSYLGQNRGQDIRIEVGVQFLKGEQPLNDVLPVCLTPVMITAGNCFTIRWMSGLI